MSVKEAHGANRSMVGNGEPVRGLTLTSTLVPSSIDVDLPVLPIGDVRGEDPGDATRRPSLRLS